MLANIATFLHFRYVSPHVTLGTV